MLGSARGRWCNPIGLLTRDKECLFPVSPEPASYDPEEFVDDSQPWPRLLAFKDGELLAKGEIFEHQTAARPKQAKHGSEPEPKQVKHGNQVIADRLCRLPCEVVDSTAGQDCDEGQWVTVTRDIPMICPISSWVNGTLIPWVVTVPELSHDQSSIKRAIRSGAEFIVNERICRYACWHSWLTCFAACMQATPCSFRNLRKSSRFTKFSWHGWPVSAIVSCGKPEMVAFNPNTSPGLATFSMRVLPSFELADDFTRPLQRI